MNLEKKISRACKQAAALRYVRDECHRLVPVPPGQRLHSGQLIKLIIDQN